MEPETRKDAIAIAGRVTSGRGEGRYYMKQAGYRKQFVSRLGIDPYCGTLNIRLYGKEIKKFAMVRKRKRILINGFKKEGKAFGDVICYRAEVSGIACGLVIPKFSKHRAVAEIISSTMLRGRLGLRDGDRLTILVKA
ncbi:MAG: DUF120 domain-containing protein [Candidatus Micrarchaeaceae archaeon]